MRIPPIFALLILGLCMLSCNQDPCDTRVCLNDGICIDGTCDCPEGFIGPDCGIELDPCQTKNCRTSTTENCISGNDNTARCICKEGFEGDLCELEWGDKYVGFYEAEENCVGGGSTFDMQIEKGPRFQQLTLNNFHNQETPDQSSKIVVDLPAVNVMTIAEQFMPYGRVSGAGSFEEEGRVALSYQIINPDGDTLSCVATLTF